MKKLGDLWHALRGLDEETRYNLTHIGTYVSQEEMRHAEYLVKYRKIFFEDTRFPVSEKILPELHYPLLVAKSEEKDVLDFVTAINASVHHAIWEEQMRLFAPKAKSFVTTHLAQHILGMDEIKEAVALQLVMPERFHILLLGDPGTGKTDILRSASEFATKSSFGLGSGASKVGLAGSVVGKEIQPGLLAMANNGLCCIDELNLLKAEDRAALYNAMEKGFVTYDKGASHHRFEADIRLLATANPKGDQFRGKELSTIKKQFPFDAALLSRFHLIFFVRKPDLKKFEAISREVLRRDIRSITETDKQFLQQYFDRSRKLTVSVPDSVQHTILQAVTSYKAREKTLLVEITPRLTKGILSLTMACARMELREEATAQDAATALAITERSFTFT